MVWTAYPRARHFFLTVIASFVLIPTDARLAVTQGYLSLGRAPVAPGVFHDYGFLETDTAGRQAVHLLEVDPRNPAISPTLPSLR